MTHIVKIFFNAVCDLCLSRNNEIRLGRYIVNRAKGQGNGDSKFNGEYWLINLIKKQITNKHAIVFDIGANIGDWTVYFAKGMTDKLEIFYLSPYQQHSIL